MKVIVYILFLVTALPGLAQDTSEVYVQVVDVPPEPTEGSDAFFEWLKMKSTELSNSTSFDCNSDLNSKIFFQFIVHEDGSTSDFRILRGINEQIDQKAIEIIRTLELKWKPGLLNRKPVDTAFNGVFDLCLDQQTKPKGKNRKKK